MTLVTRCLEFDAGHRILNHQSKCQYLHGHRYKVEITVFAPELDELDMVVDFGVIKEKMGTWIDTHLDHNLLLNRKDPLVNLISWDKNGREPFLLSGNPTAECIAAMLLDQSRLVIESGTPLRVVGVTVWETPNCSAEVRI